jgi:hypothetical protein
MAKLQQRRQTISTANRLSSVHSASCIAFQVRESCHKCCQSGKLGSRWLRSDSQEPSGPRVQQFVLKMAARIGPVQFLNLLSKHVLFFAGQVLQADLDPARL